IGNRLSSLGFNRLFGFNSLSVAIGRFRFAIRLSSSWPPAPPASASGGKLFVRSSARDSRFRISVGFANTFGIVGRIWFGKVFTFWLDAFFFVLFRFEKAANHTRSLSSPIRALRRRLLSTAAAGRPIFGFRFRLLLLFIEIGRASCRERV